MKAECRLAGQEAPGVPNSREIWTLLQALSPETLLGTCRKIGVHAASAPVEGNSSHAGGGRRRLPRPSVLSPSREQKLYWWGKGNKHCHPQGTGENSLELGGRASKKALLLGVGHENTPRPRDMVSF